MCLLLRLSGKDDEESGETAEKALRGWFKWE